MNTVNKALKLALEQENYIIATRRYLHRHPELSDREFDTTRFIAGELEGMGIEPCFFKETETGLYALIRGGRAEGQGPTIMLRADIDALPVCEKTGASYASETAGVMHACGHDCHAAMLLAAAKILKAFEDDLSCNIKLLFQGAEETAAGAKRYVDQGVLEDVDVVYCCHVNSAYPAGTIKLLPEKCLPSADSFTIHIHGLSGHGAIPHEAKDAIVAAAAVIMNLQTLVSRGNDPLNPLVLSIGTIGGGKAYNIIANEVVMEGTTRTFDPKVRESIPARMQEIISSTARAFGCRGELNYEWKTGPVLHTSREMNSLAFHAAEAVYGKDRMVKETKGSFSDDFAYYSEKKPGFYAMIGVRNEYLDCIYPHHHEKFNVDESSLKFGCAMFVQMVLDYSSSKSKSPSSIS